jgi:protein-tyrosine-phosphatase
MQILFVCTGNTCRSPLAEALGRRVADERGLTDLAIGSAGTSAAEGQPASDGALLVGIERQLDVAEHRARQLTRELVDAADLILVMGPHHLDRVEALGGTGKAFLLTDYASRGASRRTVADPFGGGLECYRATADELDDEIRRAIERVAVERAPKAS